MASDGLINGANGNMAVKKGGYSTKSLGAKIATTISLVLIIVFLLVVKWIEVEETQTIQQTAEQEAIALAETLHKGLRTLMLNGDGQLTSDWLESIKDIGGIEYIQVVRMDGSQAFKDLKTVDTVNKFLGSEIFQRNPIEVSEKFQPEEHLKPILSIQQNLKPVSRKENGLVKLWIPIVKDEQCNACHGYETSSLRGLLNVEVSTAQFDASIAQLKKTLWLSSLFVALLVGAVLWWLLDRIVLKPVAELNGALNKLGRGITDVELPVDREDELGDVARNFMMLERSWKIREERLSLILNNIPEAVITIDKRGGILTVNRAATTMFGYDESGLLQQNILDLLGPVSGEKFSGGHHTLSGVSIAELSQTVRECVGFHKEKGVFPLELEVCHLDEDFLMMLSEADLYDLEQSNKYLFFLRDMTVRKRSEADMRLLATVVDQASEAILICDPDGHIEYVNPAFTETTGYSSEEVLGKNPNILKSGDRGREYYKEMWDSLKSGEVWRDVFVNKRKDGTLYQSEQRIAPMHDSFGNVSHMVSIQRDVTKEKGLQEQVEHLQRLESLGVLAGGIAHDFNNILACVVGNAEVLGYELPGESNLHEYLGYIQEASQRGENLCHELMAYAGKGKRKTEAIELSHVVNGISNILEATASKQIHLDIRPSEENPLVMADKTQLEQVIMNLVINATEAMPDGRGTVTVITALEEVDEAWFDSSSFHSEKLPAGVYACLTVIDNGIGMDNVTVNQIFDPFFTTKFTGRGLGMSAVLGIIQNHHGALRCLTKPGEGTTFSVIFPVLEQKEIREIEEEVQNVESTFRGSGSVLVIDDEPVVAMVASRMLETMGYEVRASHDAREALELLQELEVAAVMVDMSMPHMDGPAFIEAFRRSDSTTPIVVCSGDAGEDIRERINVADVQCIIAKPFRFKDLTEAFSELFPVS